MDLWKARGHENLASFAKVGLGLTLALSISHVPSVALKIATSHRLRKLDAVMSLVKVCHLHSGPPAVGF